MKTMNRYLLSIGGLLMILAAINSGCTNGKVTDCQNFIKTNRQIDTYFAKNAEEGTALGKKKFKDVAEQKQLAKEYLTFFLQSAQTSTKAIETIQEMSLQDEQLKTLQSDYLSITKKTKEAIDQLAVISAEQSTSTITDAIVKDPKLDPKLVQKAKQLDDSFQEKVQALGNLGGEEAKVIDKVNSYCGQPNSSSSPTNSK
jgi:uncharacterized protein YnzC (UPF0291/DUF896 family)